MRNSRARTWLLIGSLFVCDVAAAEEQPSAEQMMDDLMFGNGTVGGPFTLTDQTGRTRSDSEFRGKLMIVYFGYTFCPDVCPADLMAITQALDALGGAADDIQPVFITVDPERDTKVLSDYVAAFHPQPDRPDRLAGADSKGRQCLQGVLRESAGRASRRVFDRPYRRHLSDGPKWRVSRVYAAADGPRPVDGSFAQVSGEVAKRASARRAKAASS